MKTLKKIAFTSYIVLCTVYISFAQVPQMVKVDSMWALRTVNRTNDKGAYTVNVSEKVDSAKLVAYYINVMSQKKEVIDSNILQREWDAYNAHLRSITGMGYSQHIKAAVVDGLAGNWEVTSGGDTLSISITKDMRVTGGKIKGSVQVIDGGSIKLIGVLADQVTLKAEKGKLTGILKGEKVEMKKDYTYSLHAGKVNIE